MSDIYTYKKSIDKKVVKAVEAVLKTAAISSTKLKAGEINHVYKIVTLKKTYIARVFRYKQWPEPGKLEWIEKQLTKLRVPHAKLIYSSRDNTWFPNGFMILEFIEGLSGTEVIQQGLLTETELYRAFGMLAKKFHGVKIKKFGPVNGGQGLHENFTEMQLNGIRKILNLLTKKKALSTNPHPQVEQLINNTLRKFKKQIQPVLLHGDMSETNAIVSKNKKVILIDWDNARAGFWLADFIELTRRQLFLKEWTSNPKRMRAARSAFFAGYGKIPFSPKKLAALEQTLQVIRQIWQMNYYCFDNIDRKKFNTVKQLFYKLLKEKQ